MNLFKLDTDK